LDEAISRAFLIPVDPRKPGAVIAKCPKALRAALEELESDDIAHIRIDAVL
jgi:hypothetical protein